MMSRLDPFAARKIAVRPKPELLRSVLGCVCVLLANLWRANLEDLSKKKAKKKTSRAEIVYRQVREMTRDERPEWLHDFTDVLDVDESIYIDGCHVNSRGNKLVSSELDQLTGAGLVPKPG